MTKTEEILNQIESADANKIKFAVTDIDGVLRAKIISKEKFLKSLDEHIGFCNVIFGWDMNDAAYDNSEITGWHTGYPDAMASIDLSTYRTIPWSENIPFLLADFRESEELKEICPRTLLRKVADRCKNLGYTPLFSNEFEWFNFKETPQSLKEKNYSNPQPLTPGMFGYSMLRSSQNDSFFSDLFDLLQAFDIPMEGMHTETGDGVYEACIAYSEIVEAADRGVLLKAGVKEIASKYEIIASFMAKWNNDFPGCSGHIHQSLWDENRETNLFYDSERDHSMSQLLEYYLAGQLYCLPFILPMYAPTVNSYKRLIPGSWAATSVSWGIENRTTALRVISHSASSARLETRVPGADANPYLSMAASLASGLYGIKNKLTLDIPKTKGNEYENKNNELLSRTLNEAVAKMKASDLPKELFGEEFTNHFIKTREWEWNQFLKRVTDWEMKRYFEII